MDDDTIAHLYAHREYGERSACLISTIPSRLIATRAGSEISAEGYATRPRRRSFVPGRSPKYHDDLSHRPPHPSSQRSSITKIKTPPLLGDILRT